jgi:hypothetical protein
MPSSGMWLRAGFVRTEVSEECVASIFRVRVISELGRALGVTIVPTPLILNTLKLEATLSFQSSVLRRATQRHILVITFTAVKTSNLALCYN